jgi:hypothetical protein
VILAAGISRRREGKSYGDKKAAEEAKKANAVAIVAVAAAIAVVPDGN